MSDIKKIISIFSALFLLLGGVAFAQSNSSDKLPGAGMTPGSPFYFLDSFFENVQLTFVGSSDAKAKLKVKFAQERLSEVDVLIEKRGADDRAVDVAQQRLSASLASVNDNLSQQKQARQGVNELAKQINNTIESSSKAFKKQSKNRLKKLKEKVKSLRDQLKQASEAGNIEKARKISDQLGNVKGEISFVKARLNSVEQTVSEKGEETESLMSVENRAREKVEDVEEKLKELRNKAQALNISLDESLSEGTPSTIQKARSHIGEANFEKAQSLAEKAEAALESAEENLEAVEEKEEMRAEAQEAITEAELELQELKSELPEGVSIPEDALSEYNNLLSQAKSDLGVGNGQKASRLAEQAKDSLDQVEEQLEDEKEEEQKEQEAKREAQEALKEAQREFRLVEISLRGKRGTSTETAISNFQDIISEARSTFDAGDYEKVQRLAKKAEESLSQVEEAAEQQKERREEQREQEQEEREKELEREEKQREREEDQEEARLEQESEKQQEREEKLQRQEREKQEDSDEEESQEEEAEQQQQAQEDDTATESTEESTDKIESFSLEADDNGFYRDGADVNSLEVGADEVRLTLQVNEENTYYGGLEFEGCGESTDAVSPGSSVTVKLSVEKDCKITSYWPDSGTKKDDLQIVVK